jgi:isopenicillin N synthase-like dioxygenase
MSAPSIPSVDVADLSAGGARRAAFVDVFGRALEDTGFVAVRGHAINKARLDEAYDVVRRFFSMSEGDKRRSEVPGAKGQRGFTSFGKEHAKGETAPDLKEFFQVGRPDVEPSHPIHSRYGPNVWPDDRVPEFGRVMTQLFVDLDRLGQELLVAAAEYLGDDVDWYKDAVHEGDTILRLIHYPPVPAGANPSSIRAGAHEDINFITLLVGATEPGLELLQRDGSWLPIQAAHDEIVVDSGDMLQNVTNGLLKSTTHRVVRPAGERSDVPRFSMPCFIHPRGEVDLTPRPACVARSGGVARHPSITAGAYLAQRLREIGIG